MTATTQPSIFELRRDPAEPLHAPKNAAAKVLADTQKP